jgi:hypothetical protein
VAWVRIEDVVPEHRKHLQAGPAASWLWVCGIAYCQRQLSDGFIPEAAVPLLGVPSGAKRLVELLVKAGLFERVPGGYRIHDYHDYNERREDALDRKAKSSAQHRTAGLASGAARRTVERKTNGAVPSPSNGSQAPPSNGAPPAPVERTLNPDPTRTRSSPRPGGSTTTGVAEFLAWFLAEYPKHRKGVSYSRDLVAGESLVAELLESRTLERVQAMTAEMWASKDEWIRTSDYSLHVLRSQAQLLENAVVERERLRFARLSPWEQAKAAGLK